MHNAFEVMLLAEWQDASGKTRRSPYLQRRRETMSDGTEQDVDVPGYIGWSMGPDSDRDVVLKVGSWVELPAKGAKRLANYMAGQPWAKVRMVEKIEDADDNGYLSPAIETVRLAKRETSPVDQDMQDISGAEQLAPPVVASKKKARA